MSADEGRTLYGSRVSAVPFGAGQAITRASYSALEGKRLGAPAGSPERDRLDSEAASHPGNPARSRVSAAARRDERDRGE